MHEAALAKEIIERAIELNGSVVPVRSISIRVGEFRNVDRESLTFAFNAMRAFYAGIADTELLIEIIPLEAFCKNNGHRYRPDAKLYFACPECSGPIGEIISGQELDIVELKASESIADLLTTRSVR
jgi:hydrogenase nickel incorporation protein HypA/HybF